MRNLLFCCAALVLCCAGTNRASAGLVVNGGFETGDYTGWTESGNTPSFSVYVRAAGTFPLPGDIGVTPHGGKFDSSMGPFGSPGFLSQILATSPGQTYTLSYWLQNSSPNAPSLFDTYWGGVLISDINPLPAQPYTLAQFTVTATSASTELKFGFQQNPSQMHLDDVSVVPSVAAAVPEPTSLTLVALGALGLLGCKLRRRKSCVCHEPCTDLSIREQNSCGS
jgi:hypothetical protein